MLTGLMPQMGRTSGTVPAVSAANDMVIGGMAREHIAICPKLALYASLVMDSEELQEDCPFAGTQS